MEYIIIKRTKFEGSSVSDILSIQKTAQSLEEALKYTTALKMLETDKRVEFKDRKSTRLNSSHLVISYAVFCLKKKTTLCRIQSLI